MAFVSITFESDRIAEMTLAELREERVRQKLAFEHLSKRRIEEEESFRRNCPAHAAALAYAKRRVDTVFVSITPNDWTAADPEVAEMHRKLCELQTAESDAAKAVEVAQRVLDDARTECRLFSETVQPKIAATRRTAGILAARREFAKATKTADAVPPHFIAVDIDRVESICGCVLIYSDAYRYGPDAAYAPAGCQHRLCVYHRDVAPIAVDELCHLFCAAMDAAGYPVPAHTTHAFTEDAS